MYLKRLKESVDFSVFENASPVRLLFITSKVYGPVLFSPQEKRNMLTNTAQTKLLQGLFNVILNLIGTFSEHHHYEEKANNYLFRQVSE